MAAYRTAREGTAEVIYSQRLPLEKKGGEANMSEKERIRLTQLTSKGG